MESAVAAAVDQLKVIAPANDSAFPAFALDCQIVVPGMNCYFFCVHAVAYVNRDGLFRKALGFVDCRLDGGELSRSVLRDVNGRFVLSEKYRS